jgi:serine/threonine protein phosphatase PrpC
MFGVTDVGVVRTNNEDALAVVDLTSGELVDVSATSVEGRTVGPRGVLLAVSDGMGGENAGEVASALTLETIQKHLATSDVHADPAAALAAAVTQANELVAEAAKVPGRDGMGATFVAVLIEGGTLHTAEVGDSRAYVLRRGTLTQITKDQTQIQILLDQGLMTPEMAKSSRAKNIVLQAIGKTSGLVVAQRRLDLRHGDRVLLCSDGLTGHVNDAEIAQVLGSGVALADACTELVAMANSRGGKDNVTLLTAEVIAPSSPAGVDDTVESMIATTRAFALGEGSPDSSRDPGASLDPDD